MPPLVIADSNDDVDERGYSPPPQLNRATKSDAQTRSSDCTSHATDSTGPAFLPSVNEKNEAITHGIRRTGYSLDQGDEQLAATDPAGMWDVPSSPEAKAMLAGVKSQASRTKAIATVKITRKLRRNLEQLGYESENEAHEQGAGPYREDDASPRERKTRRLGSPRAEFDTLSPAATPPPKKKRETMAKRVVHDPKADDFVPTLPVDNESSFLIDPRTLSASQKDQYQSVDLGQSTASQHSEVPNQMLGSSGTATNINTSRSDMASSHDNGIMAPTPEKEAIANMRRTRPPRRRRSSSPDVISETSRGPEKGLTDKQPLRSPTGQTAPNRLAVDEVHEQQQAHHDPDLPVPGKRPRGRPKKTASSENAKEKSAAPANANNVPKKKRGRPRKATPEAEAEQPYPEHNAGEAQGPGGSDPSDDTVAAQHQPKEDEKTHPRSGSPPTSERPEETTDGSGQHAAAGRGHRDGVDGGKAAEAKSEGKEKGPSWLEASGKPVYRVGLSKRLRIAPLLKSVRK